MQFQSQSSHPHAAHAAGAADAAPPEVADAAAALGFSAGAGAALWQALQRGQGRMAQFDHPELGGSGQWMAGGMTMLSAMGDAALRTRVDALAAALAPLAERAGRAESAERGERADAAAGSVGQTGRARADTWGAAAASGAQNGLKYAYYPEAHRLVIEDAEGMQVYDTGTHRIQGVAQQTGRAGPTFQTAQGTVELAQLRRLPAVTAGEGRPAAQAGTPQTPPTRAQPRASAGAGEPARPTGDAAGAPSAAASAAGGPSAIPAATPGDASAADAAGGPAAGRAEQALRLLEQLARLHQAGVLSAEEFQAKKAELLGRI